MNADIRTIRNILIFFCVLAVIGLILSTISGAYIGYQTVKAAADGDDDLEA